MNRKALYAGTFDPFTLGHLDIVKRSESLFDEIHLVIAAPPKKTPFLAVEERRKLLTELFAGSKKIKISVCSGLISDYAKENQIKFLIRGLRPTGDFPGEFQMATMNKKIGNGLETVFLIAGSENYYVSSSLIKEIYQHGGDISQFVPENIHKALLAKKDS